MSVRVYPVNDFIIHLSSFSCLLELSYQSKASAIAGSEMSDCKRDQPTAKLASSGQFVCLVFGVQAAEGEQKASFDISFLFSFLPSTSFCQRMPQIFVEHQN